MFISSVKDNAKVKLYQKSEKEDCFPKDYLHKSLIIFLSILLKPIPYNLWFVVCIYLWFVICEDVKYAFFFFYENVLNSNQISKYTLLEYFKLYVIEAACFEWFAIRLDY